MKKLIIITLLIAGLAAPAASADIATGTACSNSVKLSTGCTFTDTQFQMVKQGFIDATAPYGYRQFKCRFDPFLSTRVGIDCTAKVPGTDIRIRLAAFKTSRCGLATIFHRTTNRSYKYTPPKFDHHAFC